jgi:hypothetical protein
MISGTVTLYTDNEWLKEVKLRKKQRKKERKKERK